MPHSFSIPYPIEVVLAVSTLDAIRSLHSLGLDLGAEPATSFPVVATLDPVLAAFF